MNFSSKLADLLKKSGKNQNEVAALVNISPGAMSNYLSGRIPKAMELHRLASFFGVTMEYLIGDGGTELAVSVDSQILRETAPCPDCSMLRARAETAEKKLAQIQAILAK